MIDFVLLYPIVMFFERKRPGVDGWGIASCLAVPAVVSVLVFVGFAIVGKPEIAGFLNLLLFPIIMGFCLSLMLGLPAGRAALYSLSYIVFWFVLFAFLGLSGVVDAS